jgi:hypothetical protein
MTFHDIQPRQLRAHEVYGDYWFNGEPISVTGERGRVLLLDFWDYTSRESLRAIPYMREWHRKYGPSGLVVLGVHVPRFRFAQDPLLIQRAIERLAISYPVVVDNQQLVWTRYENRVWPTKHVIDRDGFVRYRGVGEGSYLQIEHSLQALLREADLLHDMPDLMEPVREEDRPEALLYRATPEILTGYLRGTIGNVEGFSPESVVEYIDPELYLDGRLYLHGPWLNERDCVRWKGDPSIDGGLVLRYLGNEVTVVLEPPRGQKAHLAVEQDGEPLQSDRWGSDVAGGPDGAAVLEVCEPRLYAVVRNREYGEHTLRLIPRESGLAVYGLACVSSVISEVLSRN